MSIIEEKIPLLENYLIDKAGDRRAIRYKTIFNFFAPGTPKNDVWDTFEAACESIAPADQAIYGALLAKARTNLPSTGFYEVFRNRRRNEYLRINNGKNPESNQIPLEKMKEIAQLERERVHKHAAGCR